MLCRKNIVRLLLFVLVVVGNSNVVFGHSTTNSSSALIEGKDGKWTLQIRASLTAFEHEVHQEYTSNSYSTPEEFEDLIIKLLSKNLSLSVNGQEVFLTHPIVKLGHETVVIYKVKASDDFKSVALKNTMFNNIFKSKNAFLVLKNDVQRNVFTLDKSNNFNMQLKIENGALVQLNTIENNTSITSIKFIIALLLTVGMVGMVIILKSKKDDLMLNN